MINKTLKGYLPALVIVLVLTALKALGQVPDLCDSGPCIHIGTYNIEWLGTKDIKKHATRSKLTVKRIAQLVSETLDLEIAVFQEINTESQEYRWFKEALEAKGYELISGAAGGEQRVVIAYDKDEVQLLGNAGVQELNVRSNFDLGGGCRSRGLRLPLAGNFRAGQFDFLLVAVHLKAQPGGKCSDDVRTEQLKDIKGQLPALMSSANERDVIIAGDFNATLDDPSLDPLLEGGFAALTAPTRLSNISYDVSYLEPPFRNVIDHLLVNLGETDEWIGTSTRIFSPPVDPSLLRTIRTMSLSGHHSEPMSRAIKICSVFRFGAGIVIHWWPNDSEAL